MEIAADVLNYLGKGLLATLTQLLVLFGPLMLLASLMHFVAAKGEQYGIRVFGMKGYLWMFGWLGTTIHELSHALFAVVFMHRIKEIKLFSPDLASGTMGYVKHEYNSKNLYQSCGNFFIGIGPVLLGTVLLYLISFLLFRFNMSNLAIAPFAPENIADLSLLKTFVEATIQTFRNYLSIVFSGEQTSWWKIVLLLYLLYAIGSSVTLSRSDMIGSARGFLVFFLILMVFNLATIWIGDFTLPELRKITAYLSGFYFLIILAIMVNIVFAVALWIIATLKTR